MKNNNIKVLFDTNIIIDILENRTNNYINKNLYPTLLLICKGYICSKQITDIFYILRKCYKSEETRKDMVRALIKTFKIINFRRKDI